MSTPGTADGCDCGGDKCPNGCWCSGPEAIYCDTCGADLLGADLSE